MIDPTVRLREWFERLAPRERRLMGVLGGVFAVFLLFLVPLMMSLMLGSRRETNRALRESIFAIKNARDDVQKRQAKREAVVARYANRAPALAGILEKAARDNELVIPESRDTPEIPHGKRYTERATVIRLRKASMLQLAKMLEQLEQQHMPIAISRLNIRRRGGERDSYDVELGVSAYDRAETVKETAPPAGGGK
jgi:general secretion pathway protein M